MKTYYLIQILHKYIRKKLYQQNVDMFSQKAVKKATLSIKNIEKKSVHLRKKRFKNSNSKNSRFNKTEIFLN